MLANTCLHGLTYHKIIFKRQTNIHDEVNMYIIHDYSWRDKNVYNDL